MQYTPNKKLLEMTEHGKKGMYTFVSEPLFIIKISISFVGGYSVEDVVYYRYKLPMNLMLKYKWYFEYLEAIVKVHHPRRHVELLIHRMDDKVGDNQILCGRDYIIAKTRSLVQGKKRTITRLLNNIPDDDLFGVKRREHDEKIALIQSEIDTLERGEFNYYVPPIYINKIKSTLNKLS